MNAAALKAYTQAIALDPSNIDAVNNLDPKLRVELVEKAVALAPKEARHWNNLGTVYQSSQQYEKAIAAFSKAIDLDPRNASVLGNRAGVYAELKQWDKAIADYSRAIDVDPTSVWALGKRANLYADLKQWDKASADYSRAIEQTPENAGALHQRAILHAQLHHWDKAAADYSRVLELNPKSVVDQNNLAWLLATCQDSKLRDPLRAVEHAKKAVELTPNQGDYWNTLGTAHYRAGEWKSAIAALEKSTELRNGGDSFDWFFLAMAHWQLGKKDEARKWHDKAVAWMDKNQPGDEELVRFRAEAESLLKIEKKAVPK
jgi:tetratricopeptide (TPR) repeat protein